jgi:predicted dehydrogenase
LYVEKLETRNSKLETIFNGDPMQDISPLGIGIVGLGGVANAHQAGYEMFGLPVVAGFDPVPAARERFAGRQPQASVYDSLEALLDDPNVDVVDMATPHHRPSRVPLVEKVVGVGKPLFVQKPLGIRYEDALDIATILKDANVPGMVNQNMCFTPGGMALAPLVVDEKIVGEPFLGHMELRICFDTAPDHWYGKDERWWMVGHTVHHLAVLHMAFGPPERVYAVTGRDPSQPGVEHDGFGHLTLSYASGLHITLLSTGTYYGTSPKPYGSEELWVQGPLGVLDWRAEGGYTLSLRTGRENPDEAARRRFVPLEGHWFPDAFGLGMAHFQGAVRAGVEPLCSVQDNLYVMAVIEAAYLSSGRRQAVMVHEVMGERYDPAYGPGWRHGWHDWHRPEPIKTVRGKENVS